MPPKAASLYTKAKFYVPSNGIFAAKVKVPL